MTVSILTGDCRDVLKTLPDGSVHCIVTSPPYFGLRDYGVAGQIGLEETPNAFVGKIVEVFRDVRRVLRDDGTLWLNLGDSYAGSWGAQGHRVTESDDPSWHSAQINAHPKRASGTGAIRQPGVKPKDLIGIPWRVAFALQADGWFLRQDIIWSKPNPMPESVTDRCTKAHEYLFLLSKSGRYYFDALAIAEVSRFPEGPGNTREQVIPGSRDGTNANITGSLHKIGARSTRNKRSVWTVATHPFKEAHFATFPPDLVEPCIKAGTSEDGCCAACGAPRSRLYRKELVPTRKAAKTFVIDERDLAADAQDQGSNRQKDGHRPGWVNETETLGWAPTCECAAGVAPCVVLDPFGGAGTTGLVADRLQRDAILIELNPDYAALARRRVLGDATLLAEVRSPSHQEAGGNGAPLQGASA